MSEQRGQGDERGQGEQRGQGDDTPKPHGPKDAALADPPSNESAEHQEPSRTPGLGNVLAEPMSTSQSQSADEDNTEDEDQ